MANRIGWQVATNTAANQTEQFIQSSKCQICPPCWCAICTYPTANPFRFAARQLLPRRITVQRALKCLQCLWFSQVASIGMLLRIRSITVHQFENTNSFYEIVSISGCSRARVHCLHCRLCSTLQRVHRTSLQWASGNKLVPALRIIWSALKKRIQQWVLFWVQRELLPAALIISTINN